MSQLHFTLPRFPKAPGLREVFKLRGRWLAAVLAVAILFAPAPAFAAPPGERYFRITASSFEYAPAVLTVNPGDHVTIDLVAADVVHGLYVDGYGLSVTADPGQTARLIFIADRPGTFRFRCSITCGPLHPFLIGKLTVGPNWLWWRALALAALVVTTVIVDHTAGRRAAPSPLP